jgi:hypothetical protein
MAIRNDGAAVRDEWKVQGRATATTSRWVNPNDSLTAVGSSGPPAVSAGRGVADDTQGGHGDGTKI